MNASKFMDKQIMDLSRSKSGNHNEFIDLMNPPPEADEDEESSSSISANLTSSTRKQHQQQQQQQKPDILPSYDFHPIRPTSVPAAAASSDSVAAMGGGDGASSTFGRAWGSADSKASASTARSYGYLGSLEPDKAILEKAQNLNGAEIVSEIDRTMKKHTDNLLHAIDSLSARLSQLESRTRQIEHSVDDLKESIGNSHGSTDGKMRQLENILREVQSGVQDLKDKQEVIEAQMHLAKLQIPKAEHTAESHTTATSNVDPAAQQQPSSAPQHQQFPVPSPQTTSVPVLPHPNAPPPPSQQAMHSPPPPKVQNQYSPSPISSLPQRDGYFPLPSQTQEGPAQQYLLPSTQQPHQQQSSPLPSQPQQPPQYQSGSLPTPYQQAPQPPQLNPPPVGNPTPLLQPPLGHHSDGTAYMPTGPSQSFPPSNPHQPPSQLTSGPPSSSQGYYGVIPHQICDPPPPVRSSSGFPSSAYPPPPTGLTSDHYPYSGSPSRYDGVPPMKAPPLSSSGGSNYPQIPAARILPQAIPTAASVGGGGGGGGAGAGGSGNRVPIDDVIDKVTSMGFPREHVRATVRKLTENGQSVDLNIVLDKLMNDGDMQPQRGWFGR